MRIVLICTTIAVNGHYSFRALKSKLNNAAQTGLVRKWYADYYEPLVGFLRARFGSGPPDPEDIAQRTFSRLLDRPALEEVRNPRAFLWRIAHNLVVSEQRSVAVAAQGVQSLLAAFPLDEGYLLVPERVLEAKEQLRTAIGVLERMPERRRRAFLMVRVDGLTQAEVASRLGISPPAVSKHIGNATADLYDALLRLPSADDNV